MGQSIEVKLKQMDAFCVFTTDRSLTGQDSARFSTVAEAETVAGFPATLAARLFHSDESIDNVYVAGNDVIVRSTSPWDQASIDTATTTISDLFRFYE